MGPGTRIVTCMPAGLDEALLMFAYIVRRIAYAIPILIGINLLTFALFFVVNTPDDMARMHLGMKRVTPEAIEKWKAEHQQDYAYLTDPDGYVIELKTYRDVGAALEIAPESETP